MTTLTIFIVAYVVSMTGSIIGIIIACRLWIYISNYRRQNNEIRVLPYNNDIESIFTMKL